MRFRVPIWLPAIITLLATIGVRYQNFRVQEAAIIGELTTRKAHDARLMSDFIQARLAPITDSQEQQRAVVQSAIANRHRTTLVVVQADYPSAEAPIQLADNLDDLGDHLFDGVLNQIEAVVNDHEMRVGGIPDEGVLFTVNGHKYLLHEKKFTLTTPKGQVGAGLRVSAQVILVTDLTVATEDTRGVALFWGVTLAIVVLTGITLVLCTNVLPINTITKQLAKGQIITVGRFAPYPISRLASEINTARRKAEQYAKNIEDNQRIWRHDLLSNIKGVYDMFDLLDIIGFKVTDSEYAPTYEMARNAAASCYKLVETTRKLTDLENEIDLQPTKVCDVFDELRRQYSQNNVIFTPVDDVATVMIDYSQFTLRAMTNLINNAIRYSDPPNELVEITYRSKDGKGFFMVKDNGLGITPEGIEKITGGMGESVRLNPEIPGSGLGLYSVRRILQAHGGSLSIKSKIGEGSIFIAMVKAA